MKRKQHSLFFLIGLFILLFSFSLGIAQEAETSPIKTTITLAKTTFSQPEEVSVTIQIANGSNMNIPGSLSLFYPDGNPVTDFGDKGSVQIAVGAVETWTGYWNVTQEELESGNISFSVKYSVYDKNNTLQPITEEIEKEIVYNPASPQNTNQGNNDTNSGEPSTTPVSGPSLEFTAHYAVPTIAAKGDKVGFYFTIRNNGDVDLENITITNNKTVSAQPSVLSELKVGEERSAQIANLTMPNKDLKSVFKITYQAAGSNKKYTLNSEEVVIKKGTPQLSATLEASAKGVNKDEKVTLTLTLTNSGKKDFVVSTVEDVGSKNGIGEVFTNITVPAEKSIKETKDVIISEDMTFRFIVTAADASNNAVVLTTKEVTVKAADPSKTLMLTVHAEFDRTEMTPDNNTANVVVNVTNTGGFDAKNVRVLQGETTLHTFSDIPINQSRSFTREIQFSQAGRFQFSATAKNIFDADDTFYSDEIIISMAAPTPEPEAETQRTMPSLVTEAIPTQAEFSPTLLSIQKVLNVLFYALAAIILVCVVLLIVSLAKRQQNKKKSESAVDHLQRYTRRDYTAVKEDDTPEADINPDMMEEADEVEEVKNIETTEKEAEEKASTQKAEPGQKPDETMLPHEKYISAAIIEETEKTKETDSAKQMPLIAQGDADIISGGTGRYRLTRPEEVQEESSSEEQDSDADEKPRKRRSDR